MKRILKFMCLILKVIWLIIGIYINYSLIRLFTRNISNYLKIIRNSKVEDDEKFVDLESKFIDKYLSYVNDYYTMNNNHIFIAEFPFKEFLTQSWFLKLYNYGIDTYKTNNGTFVTTFKFSGENILNYVICIDTEFVDKLTHEEYRFIVGQLIYQVYNEKTTKICFANQIMDESRDFIKDSIKFSINEWNKDFPNLLENVDFDKISKLEAENYVNNQKYFAKIKGKEFPFKFKEKLSLFVRFLFNRQQVLIYNLYKLYYKVYYC